MQQILYIELKPELNILHCRNVKDYFFKLRSPENITMIGNQINLEHASAFWPVRVWAGVTCEVIDAQRPVGPRLVSVLSTLA